MTKLRWDRCRRKPSSAQIFAPLGWDRGSRGPFKPLPASLCPPAARLGRQRGLRGTGNSSTHGPCRRLSLAKTRAKEGWRRKAERLLRLPGLTNWEMGFLLSLRSFQNPSAKQLACLDRIAARVDARKSVR
jgi:hypothetical protein